MLTSPVFSGQITASGGKPWRECLAAAVLLAHCGTDAEARAEVASQGFDRLLHGCGHARLAGTFGADCCVLVLRARSHREIEVHRHRGTGADCVARADALDDRFMRVDDADQLGLAAAVTEVDEHHLLERRAQRGQQQRIERIAARFRERRVNRHVGRDAARVIAFAERGAHLTDQAAQGDLLRFGDVAGRKLRALHFDRAARLDDVSRVHLRRA